MSKHARLLPAAGSLLALLLLSACASKVHYSSYPAPPPPPPPVPVALYEASPEATRPIVDRENYAPITANPVLRVAEQPVSTFAIDADGGSYSNVRRLLNQGRLPPADAVRIEELVNYFDYADAAPADASEPFAVHSELAASPWQANRHLLRIAIEGYAPPPSEIPAANLVFLIDSSGSMNSPDKLPLLVASFKQLLPSLRAQDRVSIVAYAGSAGLVLPPTPGDRRRVISAALDRLQAGGSTAGGAGLTLAYAQARAAFIEGGSNWVLLATDGDFNVGVVSHEALVDLVERERSSGVGLMTLGLGGGNYNDALAEQLANHGNGQYAYIDSLREGSRVLRQALSSSLLTIAADVKLQVEFNPAVVAEYRLIGFENRLLERADFANDRVDAGEIGAGQDVTAYYELALVGSGGEQIAPLRYGSPEPAGTHADELGHLRWRYKLPGADSSVERSQVLPRQIAAAPSEDWRFGAAVVAFGDLLRGAEHLGDFGYAELRTLARAARGADPDGLRAEFEQLVALAESLQPSQSRSDSTAAR